MNCADFEHLLADYVDDTLSPDVRASFEEHAVTCPDCRQLLDDVTGVVQFLKRIEDIEPPAELITRIAFQTPIGRFREPLDPPGWWGRFSAKWLQPVLQPRFAMGMAMTILSFAMLERCTGVQVQHIQAADLNPVRVWDNVQAKSLRVKDRAVKYYENIRLVYEIETRLQELDQQQQAASEQASNRSKSGAAAQPKAEDHSK
jgi:Putative zinc-finger